MRSATFSERKAAEWMGHPSRQEIHQAFLAMFLLELGRRLRFKRYMTINELLPQIAYDIPINGL